MDDRTVARARLWRSLYRIRHVEERLADLYPADVIQSPMHLSIGQEWIAVGVCDPLRPGDVVFGTYRGHAMYLARGGRLLSMLHELFGHDDGCCGGVGGSMHLADVQAGVMPASAVVGTTIPVAVGYAYAQWLRRSDALTISFFGDGAMEEGVFHESLNFAVLHHLDVLFVCENNQYAIHTPLSVRRRNVHLLDYVEPYDIAGCSVEYGDVEGLHAFTTEVIQQVGRRRGPWFVECPTYRWRQHVGPDDDFGAGYRSRADAQVFIDHDPLLTLEMTIDPGVIAQSRWEVDAELNVIFVEALRGSRDSR